MDEPLQNGSSSQNPGRPAQNEVPQLSFDNAPLSSISLNGFVAPPTSISSNGFVAPPSLTPIPPVPFNAPAPIDEYAQKLFPQQADSLGVEAVDTNVQQALVPYQPPQPYQMDAFPSNSQATMSLQLIPEHIVEHLLPAQMQQARVDDQNMVRIPSFYESERPAIPHKRIFNGFISVIVVSLLLCGGAGYLVKASGTWHRFTQFINPARPTNISIATAQLPDPTVIYEKGDAADTIPSATLTNDFNQQDAIVRQEAHVFQVDKTFYLVCSELPPAMHGTLTFKWYMNKMDYADYTYQLAPDPKDANKTIITLLPTDSASKGAIVKTIDATAGTTGTIDLSMRYVQPAEGYVEVYWNNVLAWRLYFVVR
jgi:hypothetical protein